MSVPCSLFLGRLSLACLLLVPAIGFAQDVPAVTSPAAPAVGLLAPPPVRCWVLSTGPFNSIWYIWGLTPYLRVERVVRPHLALAVEGAFRRTNFAPYSRISPDRITAGSLSGGVRYYFTATAPKGFYGEALVGGQYNRTRYGDLRGSRLFVRPEVGVGYQFLIGKRRRFVADLGGRLYSQHRLHPSLAANEQSDFRVTFIPSVRIGFAF